MSKSTGVPILPMPGIGVGSQKAVINGWPASSPSSPQVAAKATPQAARRR